MYSYNMVLSRLYLSKYIDVELIIKKYNIRIVVKYDQNIYSIPLFIYIMYFLFFFPLNIKHDVPIKYEK